jgi:hypothetical protein
MSLKRKNSEAEIKRKVREELNLPSKGKLADAVVKVFDDKVKAEMVKQVCTDIVHPREKLSQSY